jgi:uncharacterized membrane protein (DUF2068 family)
VTTTAPLGVVPLVVAWGLWRRRAWAWHGAWVVGVALATWIAVEVATIGYQPDPPLQAAYGFLSLVILGLAPLPSVRRRARSGPARRRSA